MVVGGNNGKADIANVEIIDLNSSSSVCQPVKDYPLPKRGMSGGLLDNKIPFACSGQEPSTNRCYKYEKPNWVLFPGMTIERFHFSILPISQFQGKRSYIFATGGYTDTYTEIYNGESWYVANITDIPFTTYVSCMTYVDDSTLLISGGMQGSNSNGEKVFLFSLLTNIWIEGPSMQMGKFAHSCGRIISDNNTNQKSVIVAGGLINFVPIFNVEILDYGSSFWRYGKFT